jgi:poly-gamma-glutamate synthesis protein (capsule biosynthesis protein)
VILTADHGGLGVAHGRRLPEDLTIPWIIAGPGVKVDHPITDSVSIMDTAATAAHLLGLTLPPEAAGRLVRDALVAPPIPGPSTSNPSTPNPPITQSLTPASTALSPPPITRLIFTGDLNPGRCPAQIALANNDFTLPYQAVADVLRAADLTIGSLDGAISDISAPSPCPRTQNLIGPARSVEGLQFAGFDVITVATNHAKDCGALGFGCESRSFLDTLYHLSAAGLLPVGGGADLAAARAPATVERNGVRFAFLGVTEVGADTWATESRPGTAPLSADTLPAVLADIQAARAQAEVVIVLTQWGVEYAEMPDLYQREWARQMIEAGAVLVVGNHPHTVQPLERFPSGLVAYALGNFVFDQGPWRTRQGAVLEVVFRGAQLEAWRLLPVHIEGLHQPRWADSSEAEAILARMPLLP